MICGSGDDDYGRLTGAAKPTEGLSTLGMKLFALSKPTLRGAEEVSGADAVACRAESLCWMSWVCGA